MDARTSRQALQRGTKRVRNVFDRCSKAGRTVATDKVRREWSWYRVKSEPLPERQACCLAAGEEVKIDALCRHLARCR